MLYKERELLTAEGKQITNQEEIVHLLTAIWKLKKVTAIHRKGLS